MTPEVKAAFTNIRNCDAYRYVDYWDQLTARTPGDIFKRFLFSFCSVHTTWEGNVNGYKAIAKFERWLDTPRRLRDSLVVSGVGLHNNRAKWIDQFATQYWADPKSYLRSTRESWADYRNRIEAQTKGLGHAKTTFALELAFPLEAQVACLDVHMLRLYGEDQRNGKMNWRQYALLESDWVGRSQAAGLPPFIVRQIYWDGLQGKPDSRYWSHVLEDWL